MSNSPRRKAIKRRQLALKRMCRRPLDDSRPYAGVIKRLEAEVAAAILGSRKWPATTTPNGDGTFTHRFDL